MPSKTAIAPVNPTFWTQVYRLRLLEDYRHSTWIAFVEFVMVSYSLLVFFCGMFVTVEGFNKTGIPSAMWDFMEPYAQIDHISGIAILAVVIVVLSNLPSNVPTVLLLGARVAAATSTISPEKEKKTWLILSWLSTVAGNLSLLGSAANLIVCEQARRSQNFCFLTGN